ncbi:MAG TPA: carboxypeptidase regulatory-like domain-containing protein [Solirubrobacteraceae bacterium]|nr:carboxypeptidase regulatory-like domain-containing protein [Solirubrobacteraceae bacterium]
MGMRMWRMHFALLGVLGVAALAPQLASADTTGGISGTVTDAALQDLSGVTVQAMNDSTGNDYDATTTNGAYALSGLPAGSYQVLFRPGAGQNVVYQYYPDKSGASEAQAVSVTAGQTTMNINASLATGATVSGVVTDAAGNPLSGVGVYVDDYGTGDFPYYVYSNSATTNSSGQWSVDGLPTGTYQVDFQPPDGSNYAFQYYDDVSGENPPTPVTLTAGSTTSGIDAALTMGGQISGTVMDGTTTPASPAPGVEVAAVDASGEQSASTTTDSNGNYTLSGLSPSASYRVEFTPPEGSPLAQQFYPSGLTLQAATPVPVTVGQTTPNIDETLGEGGSIAGAVTNAATGYPIGGVEVVLTDDAGNGLYMDGETSTEPDGTYDVTNLPPGSYKVEFYDGGFFSEGGLAFQYYNDASTLSAADSVTVGAGQAITNINAALTQGGILEGHLTNGVTGEGLADAEVEVLDGNNNELTHGFTTANGDYEIPGIAPGSYYVEFLPYYNSDSYQPVFYGGSATLAGATPVTITAGSTTAGIDGVLAPGSATSPGQSTPLATGATAMAMPQAPPMGHVTSGPPTLSGGSLSGLAKGKPVVKFRLASGSNGAAKLRSFKVKLPAGLAFVAAELRKGVKVTGGGRVTEKLTGGQLVVTLGSATKAVTVLISAPAVKVTTQLAVKAAQKKTGTLRIGVTATLVNGGRHTVSFTVKNPA